MSNIFPLLATEHIISIYNNVYGDASCFFNWQAKFVLLLCSNWFSYQLIDTSALKSILSETSDNNLCTQMLTYIDIYIYAYIYMAWEYE